MKKDRLPSRPEAPTWNRDFFAAVCGLALLLSGLTYDHSAFEVRTGSIWLLVVCADCALSYAVYRRRIGKWREAGREPLA